MGISGSIWFFNHSNFKEFVFRYYFKVFSIVNTYVFSLQPIPTDPNESFAWKDSTLDRKLKELEERAKKQGDVHLDVNGFDKNIDKSIGNWSSLPKAPNSDILLLQKARGKITTKIKY